MKKLTPRQKTIKGLELCAVELQTTLPWLDSDDGTPSPHVATVIRRAIAAMKRGAMELTHDEERAL